MFGRLSLSALSQDWIENLAGASMGLGALAILGLITYHKRWTWLWKEWVTTTDHKKIGVMYIVVSIIMFVKGLVDALMMRAQQAVAAGDSMGYLGAEHFQQIFTAHGVTMIFFVGMGLVFGLINLIMPLQIGARDVAFPFLNAVSFWLFVAGSFYILLSLVVGKFAGTGWTAYPPLSGIKYSPGEGVDYWAWSIQISGIGSMLSGVNFLVTILKMRCRGMTLWKMPVFVWATLATVILVIFAFPILTATIAMLSTDRLIDTKLFTAGYGGNPMMYINLIWAWGHPEVYILVLPVFGVFSEIVPVFSHKRLFGYSSMVWAIMGITVLSFIVWLHHFFTMGAGGSVNAFFGIMTALIAIPTGVKVFNWLFTMYRGRVEFTTPMLWFMGFIFLFVSGGMTGVMMSIPAIDFQMHNSLFLVAHFHSVIIGAVVFGFFSAYAYWFPKVTGFRLNERLGKWSFWFWFVGFIVAFFPLYLLGFMGATRRLNHYAASTGWQPLFIVASIGAFMILVGVGFQVLQLLVSIKNRNKEKKGVADPWNGRTLEWAIPSPAPFYNFAHEPQVHERDAWWAEKHRKEEKKLKPYEDIHMPKNSNLPCFIGIISCIGGFALVWHIFWLAALSILGVLACLIIRLMDRHTEYNVPAVQVEQIEKEARS